MKNIILSLLLVSTLIMGYKLGIQNYEMKGIVTEVIQPCKDYPEGLVIFVDKTGNEWSFEGSEDWFEYDLLEAEMCDNGTDWTTDDTFIHATYTGYVNEFMVNRHDFKDLLY